MNKHSTAGTFEEWIAGFAPTLWFDTYTFKGELLRAMRRGFERGGPAGAVEFAKPWRSVHRKLKGRMAS